MYRENEATLEHARFVDLCPVLGFIQFDDFHLECFYITFSVCPKHSLSNESITENG